MKAFIGEVFDPIKDFYRMRKWNEIAIVVAVPLFMLGLTLILSYIFQRTNVESIYALCDDLLNQLGTILALFISFSMAYLSIIISSSSKNVDDLKETYSKIYAIDNKPCTMYQVLSVDLTYTLDIQIIFLMFVLLQKFIISVCNGTTIHVLIAVDVAGIVHILIMMLVIVKNIYYSFWKSK